MFMRTVAKKNLSLRWTSAEAGNAGVQAFDELLEALLSGLVQTDKIATCLDPPCDVFPSVQTRRSLTACKHSA